jgi:hypothetical protein
MTVEDLLEVVRRLPPEASAVKAIGQGLYFFDSGALAALLKELNKSGHVRRAQEVGAAPGRAGPGRAAHVCYGQGGGQQRAVLGAVFGCLPRQPASHEVK